MTRNKDAYRKNYLLIIAFLALVTVLLVVALVITRSLTGRYVENEFASRKIDVLEQTLRPYNEFFQNKVSEITSYQGFLDSTSASKYAASVFADYFFVKRIDFYVVTIGARAQGEGLDITTPYAVQFRVVNRKLYGQRLPAQDDPDFTEIANKLNNFIAGADTSRLLTQDEIFKTFYEINPDKISYLNVPRREEIKAYRDMYVSEKPPALYKQNMLTFHLDPYALKVRNTHPELYQHISIQPVVYEPLEEQTATSITEIAFPGAFSDYKLYFQSSEKYLNAEINHRFLPTAAIVLLIYFFLVIIGWLIYRNLDVNLKLFKLQYDFINNFTHEFKTPVSVIKIAGSNLRNGNELSERQLKHYGKILDEEADKLNELMNKLPSFTQIENRSIKQKKEEIYLEDFVKKYIESFRLKYPDFKLEYRIGNVYSFYTDPVLLGSIFQNLMENAYKYSPPNRKELMIRVMQDKRNIVFHFADRGIGVPRKEIDNIFKKFYRIESKYNQNGSVGLGLAFCKELVNFMSGQITVKSKENEGSEFVVSLPYES